MPSHSNPIAYQLPGLSIIRVAGKEAIKVLNGLCTAKLPSLTAGQATEAFFTDDRGRVLAHAMLALEPNDSGTVWVFGLFKNASALAAHIDRFIFREDATPKDVGSGFQAWLVDGLQLDPSGAGYFRPFALSGGQEGTWICPWPLISAQSQVCLVPVEIESAFREQLDSQGCGLGPAEGWQSLRIANFWPLEPAEITERTLPQELDRDAKAISFTKGCYLGQETVARLDALGEVQRKLCLVELDGWASQAARKLVDQDKEVGSLTSIAPELVDGKRLALASMKRGWMTPGSRFTLLQSDPSESKASGQVISHP